MARRWQIQIESNGNLLTLGTKNKGFFCLRNRFIGGHRSNRVFLGGNHGRWRNYSSNRAHGPFSSRVTSKGITELELSKLGIFSANKRNRCSFSLTAHVAASGKFSYGAVKQTVVLPLDYKKRHVLLFDGATRLSGSTGQEIYFFFCSVWKSGEENEMFTNTKPMALGCGRPNLKPGIKGNFGPVRWISSASISCSFISFVPRSRAAAWSEISTEKCFIWESNLRRAHSIKYTERTVTERRVQSR